MGVGIGKHEEVSTFDDIVGKKSRLTGRTLQPWRAILAVAAWLDQAGVSNLFERIENLSFNYQNERLDFEPSDNMSLVIRAILQYVVTNVANVANVPNVKGVSEWQFTTAEITEICKMLADESDGEINSEYITSQRIGHILKKMRLSKPLRPRGQKSRIWKIARDELVKLAGAYSIQVPEEIQAENPRPSLKIGDIGNIGDIGYKDTHQPQINIIRGEL